jgi:hypothetical protein
MYDTTNHLIDSLPAPATIRQSLKRNQAERSILRQMLKLAVRAQERQDENANPGDMPPGKPERRDA